MRYPVVKNAFLSVALGAFVPFAIVPAMAQGGTKPNQASAPTSPDLDAAKGAAQQIGDEIIVITKKIPKEEKPAPGPPSKEKLLMDEARERLELLKTMQSQTLQAIKQAEQAKNPAEAQVLAKEAKSKAEFAEHFKQTITGPPPAPATASTSSGANATPPPSRKLNFNSGALQQLQESAKASQGAASERDPNAARQRSNEAFGAGRAGAGGVTLYKAATMVTPLDKSKISNAAVENGRLVLVYDGKKIPFPKFDPDFLALAIRSVYGGEGLVHGTLLAIEDNAVVLRTGKEQYGDVAWKKEFLPQLPNNLTIGQELALDLGPGVGALDLPEPSFERITYYGPLKGTSLGQVVQESDMVYSMFWYGTDWRTGLPLDLSKVPGYKSAIELDLESPVEPPSKRPEPTAKNWWDETVWFVWSPNEMSLEMAPDGSEFRFTKATMRVVTWSVQPERVSARYKAEGEYLTQHFDDYGRAFPVLERLREAAKTIAVVRWLKLNNVPLDQTWAKTYALAKVPTPDKVRRYSVYVSRDKSGKPEVESPATGGTQ